MGLSLVGNADAQNTIRNISTIQHSLLAASRRLSSGLRINQASEDPAGLAVSEQMRAQIGSIAQELINLDNNVNKSQSADSALEGLGDKLVEVREVAVAAAEGATNDGPTQAAYAGAADEVVSAYNRTITETSYGNQKLLDGSPGSVVNVKPLPNLDLSTPEKAAQAVARIDSTISELGTRQIQVGANTKNYLQSVRSNLETTQNNLVSAESAVRDADQAAEQATVMRRVIQMHAGVSLLAQGNLASDSVFKLLSS